MILWNVRWIDMERSTLSSLTVKKRNVRQHAKMQLGTSASAPVWAFITEREMMAVGLKCPTCLQLVGVIRNSPVDY